MDADAVRSVARSLPETTQAPHGGIKAAWEGRQDGDGGDGR